MFTHALNPSPNLNPDKVMQHKNGGQDSLVDKALGRNVLGSILASTTKGAHHERLIVPPCEIIQIC
jgi:hypothetical protein